MKTTLWKVKGATTNPLSKCYQNISLKITSRAQARFTLMSSQWRFQTLSNQHNCRQLFKCTTVICLSVPCKASHCGIVSRKDCTCRGCCFFLFHCGLSEDTTWCVHLHTHNQDTVWSSVVNVVHCIVNGVWFWIICQILYWDTVVLEKNTCSFAKLVFFLSLWITECIGGENSLHLN